MANVNLISALDKPLRILKVFGIVRLVSNNKIKVFLYKTRSILMWLLIATLIVPQGIQLFMVQSVKELPAACFLALTDIAFVFKFVIFTRHLDQFEYLLSLIKSPLFKATSIVEERIIRRVNNRSKLVTITLIDVTLLYILIVWTLVFFIAFHKMRLLPIPASYPFSIAPMYMYLIVYGTQIGATLLIATTNLALDVLLADTLLILNGKLEIFGHRLTTIASDYADNYITKILEELNDTRDITKADIIIRQRIDELLNQYEYCKVKKGNVYGQLMFAAIQYKEILHVLDVIEVIFSKAAFAQIVTTVIVLSMSAYELLREQELIFQVFFLLYLITMGIQLGIPCYTANEINYTSKSLYIKAYLCNFLAMNKEETNIYIMLMHWVMKEITFKAKFIFTFPLDMKLLTSITQLAYSILAVLASKKE